MRMTLAGRVPTDAVQRNVRTEACILWPLWHGQPPVEDGEHWHTDIVFGAESAINLKTVRPLACPGAPLCGLIQSGARMVLVRIKVAQNPAHGTSFTIRYKLVETLQAPRQESIGGGDADRLVRRGAGQGARLGEHVRQELGAIPISTG